MTSMDDRDDQIRMMQCNMQFQNTFASIQDQEELWQWDPTPAHTHTHTHINPKVVEQTVQTKKKKKPNETNLSRQIAN